MSLGAQSFHLSRRYTRCSVRRLRRLRRSLSRTDESRLAFVVCTDCRCLVRKRSEQIVCERLSFSEGSLAHLRRLVLGTFSGSPLRRAKGMTRVDMLDRRESDSGRRISSAGAFCQFEGCCTRHSPSSYLAPLALSVWCVLGSQGVSPFRRFPGMKGLRPTRSK